MKAHSDLAFLAALQNRYHVLRHGHSEGNAQNVIVGDPQRGVDGFGLTNLGRDQVALTLHQHRVEFADVSKIVASDFLRTRQTAAIVGAFLSIDVELSPMLRERFFGKWEHSDCGNYQEIWKQDALTPHKSTDGVESVLEVAKRTTDLVRRIESQVSGQHVLLVSHGDPLQILLTAICGRDLNRHRSMPVLQTAELRPIAESACLS